MNVSHAVISFQLDGTILDANQKFLDLLGYSLTDVRGRHHSMFVEAAEYRSVDYVAFWQALRNGEFRTGQFKRIGKGGKVVWIEGYYNPIIGSNGRVAGVVGFATDITAQIEILAYPDKPLDRDFEETCHAAVHSSRKG
ncbi:PAS domain-containing protein [Niveispirillum lacus]|uniref:PAS domain-containing protein n=1 Tax=Niveispirillum lacus TaxID=1981099 RepID=UPI002481EEA9|nr:PAS domain-containing protein [Niveispirillum lacus]